MRVLMTGGNGLIGKATAERLLSGGWEVRLLDQQPEAAITGVDYVQADILAYDDLLKAARGCDGVIHLAALRSPSLAPGQDVFRINAAGTFNVFEAATAAGIRRVVQASSINALGSFYGTVEIAPPYFPVDEEHPHFTTDPYSFSKEVIEQIGAYYWRREGISSVALRFPGVHPVGFGQNEGYRQRRVGIRAALDDLARLPDSEQRARIAEVRQRAADLRRQRPLEFGQPPLDRTALGDDPLLWTYLFDRFNFWAFIDVRDAAQSLEKGLSAAYEGDYALFANAAVNALDYDARTLIRLFFPEVTPINGDLSGAAALISSARARELIGFAPEYGMEGKEG